MYKKNSFYEVENGAGLYTARIIIICENNHSRYLTTFAKRFLIDVCHGSEYTSDFEYARVLNILGFWIYQSCKYARDLNMLLVLNISVFWIYHGSNYARVTQGSKYVWICLNNS